MYPTIKLLLNLPIHMIIHLLCKQFHTCNIHVSRWRAGDVTVPSTSSDLKPGENCADTKRGDPHKL